MQLSVVVTDVCGGGRKWPNEDDCSARHSTGLFAIYFRAPLLRHLSGKQYEELLVILEQLHNRGVLN